MKQSFTLLPLLSIAKRELIRFYRQRSRIIGSLLTPILFWLLLGGGLSAAFPTSNLPGGGTFIQYYFPANLVLTILFVSIFSNMSLIEDRHEGFLQGVLVAPISGVGMVGGKVLGGALIALFQGILFMFLFPLAGISMDLSSILSLIGVLFLLSLMLTALGFAFAWKVDSTQGFHSVMNTVLLPMWILSGTFFPIERAPQVLKPLMYLNPLTYGYVLVKSAMLGETSPTFSHPLALLLTVVYTIIFILVGILLTRKNREVLA